MTFAFDRIVSVEDSDTDFMALQFALHAAGITVPVERCATGRHARQDLLTGDSCPLKEKATLILLDLKLPENDGRELLRELRARDPKREVPVIVLSTSSHPRDISDSYRAGADAYVVKPFELDDWQQQVGALAGYWLATARLARGSAPELHPGLNRKSKQRTAAHDLSKLARAIEGEVIPRLLLAHGPQDGAGPAASGTEQPQFKPDDVEELARIALGQDVSAAAAFVHEIRTHGVSLEGIFQELIAPAARLVGDLWKADVCTFAQFSQALGCLQRLLAELNQSTNETMH